jgi:hypothetical protein
MQEKNNPPESGLEAEIQGGSDGAERLPYRLQRYAKAKTRALEMQAFLALSQDTREKKLSGKLSNCGNWLRFRQYWMLDKVRLVGARFCRKHLICPLCAIRRGAKQLKAYLDRFEVIKCDKPALMASMVTLTVLNGPDLIERLDHLQRGLKLLNQRRRDTKRYGGFSEWRKVEGLVGTYEVTRNQSTLEWHPHCHMIVLHDQPLSEPHLTNEWHQITGDSFIVDITPLKHPDDPARDFIEVFKYVVKFSELSIEDNLEVFRALQNRRLIFSAGCFRGVDVPEDLLDSQLSDTPFVDLFYRFLPGVGYSFECRPGELDEAGGGVIRSVVGV